MSASCWVSRGVRKRRSRRKEKYAFGCSANVLRLVRAGSAACLQASQRGSLVKCCGRACGPSKWLPEPRADQCEQSFAYNVGNDPAEEFHEKHAQTIIAEKEGRCRFAPANSKPGPRYFPSAAGRTGVLDASTSASLAFSPS